VSSRASILQVSISWILRAGVALSMVLESLGILLNYLQTGQTSLVVPSADWLAKGGNLFGFVSTSVASVVSGPSPSGVTALGVAVLMLTPYARIIAGIIYYTLDRDWNYVGITLVVFSVITFGLIVL
jgi:uncharacterized membrane protein